MYSLKLLFSWFGKITNSCRTFDYNFPLRSSLWSLSWSRLFTAVTTATCWSLITITNKHVCLVLFLFIFFFVAQSLIGPAPVIIRPSCWPWFLMVKLLLCASAGLPCRSSTRHARCPAASITSQGALLSRGWPSTRAASPQSKAASMSGMLWPTWRPPGPTHPPCSSTGETLQAV